MSYALQTSLGAGCSGDVLCFVLVLLRPSWATPGAAAFPVGDLPLQCPFRYAHGCQHFGGLGSGYLLISGGFDCVFLGFGFEFLFVRDGFGRLFLGLGFE